MAHSSPGMSAPSLPTVNLYCTQCDSQLGIFENEWTRLTTTYLHPARIGKHFGTDVANKTQVVPEGVLNPALEGCTLAEVFCKQCSAAVGQFCKSAPSEEQVHLKHEYFYKSSKTYLKDSRTNKKIGHHFGFGGDFVGSSGKSATPRPSVPRWSQTPARNEAAPARRPAAMDNTPSRYNPSPLQNGVAAFSQASEPMLPDTAVAVRLAGQDTKIMNNEQKIKAQEARIQQQDSRLQDITKQLNFFQVQLDELKHELHTGSYRRYVAMNSNDFLANLEATVGAMKAAQSGARELDALRAENQAIRAKVHAFTSATGTHPSALLPDPAEYALPDNPQNGNSLGKRKRGGDKAKQAGPKPPASGILNTPAVSNQHFGPAPLPTPQSSNHSDQSSQESHGDEPSLGQNGPSKRRQRNSNHLPTQVSNNTNSPRNTQALDAVSVPPQSKQNPVTSFSGHYSNIYGPPEFAPNSQTPSHKQVCSPQPLWPPQTESAQSSRESNATQEPIVNPPGDSISTPALPPYPSQTLSISNFEETLSPTQPGPVPEIGNSTLEKSGATADTPALCEGSPMEISQTDLPLNDYVEFSDDFNEPSNEAEQGPLVPDREPARARRIQPQDTVIEDSLDENGRERRERSSRSMSRRVTDSVLDHADRSAAPEPIVRRRTMPRKIEQMKGLDAIEINTRETIERDLHKPKAPRVPKPHVQTTAKLLEIDLIDLGLEEWIDKDKTSPEYKNAVKEARERRREATRLAKLHSRGISVVPTPPKRPVQHQPSVTTSSQQYGKETGKDVRQESAASLEYSAPRSNVERDEAAMFDDSAERSESLVTAAGGSGSVGLPPEDQSRNQCISSTEDSPWTPDQEESHEKIATPEVPAPTVNIEIRDQPSERGNDHFDTRLENGQPLHSEIGSSGLPHAQPGESPSITEQAEEAAHDLKEPMAKSSAKRGRLRKTRQSLQKTPNLTETLGLPDPPTEPPRANEEDRKDLADGSKDGAALHVQRGSRGKGNEGVVTRRQRMSEIRRRDQLAKEAMDRDLASSGAQHFHVRP